MKRKSRRAQTSAHPHRVAAEQASPPRATRAGRRRTVTLEAWRSAPRRPTSSPRSCARPRAPSTRTSPTRTSRRWRTVFEPERSLAVLEDGSAMVATAAVFTRELTIPGGLDERRRRHRGRRARVAPPPWPAHPPHAPPDRRRPRRGRVRRGAVGVRGRRSTAASATASPPATRLSRCATAGARVHPDLPAPTGARRSSTSPRSSPRSRRSTTASGASAPGHLDRTRRGGTAASRTPSSTATAATRCAPRSTRTPTGRSTATRSTPSSRAGDDGPDAKTAVREMVADGPAATAAMWSYLIGLDLTRSLEYWIAAPDTPFANLLQGPYRPRVDLGQPLGPARGRGRRPRGADLRGAVRGRLRRRRRVLPVERAAAIASRGTARPRRASAPTPRPTSR